MTNGNDQVHEQTWVARHDGVPELNTNPKGLTKREYFAAMAMQGICGNQEFLKNLNAEPEKVSVACVEIADALINALNETE